MDFCTLSAKYQFSLSHSTVGGYDRLMKISISALSIAYGLTPEALRYYEEKGLLTPERTSSGGFRKFSSVDIQMLGIIKSLQRQGFSLDEIRRVAKEGLPLPELIAMMDEKREQMGEQIVMLSAIRNRMTSCTDLLRDHERLLMQPRICQPPEKSPIFRSRSLSWNPSPASAAAALCFRS